MKNAIPAIICIFMLCYGNCNAQSYVEATLSHVENPTNEVPPKKYTISDWKKHWSKESIIAINKIIKDYGYPDEISPNRMHWIIPGEIKKTITYTENFWFYLPFEINVSDKDSVALSLKNHL